MKNKKIAYIIMMFISAGLIAAGIVFGSMHNNYMEGIQFFVSGGILLVASVICFIVYKNKEKKGGAEQSAAPEKNENANNTVAQTPARPFSAVSEPSSRALDLKPVPDGAAVFKAQAGVDLSKFLPSCKPMQEITLLNQHGTEIEFDLIWFKKYANADYCLLGFESRTEVDEDGDPEYVRVFCRVIGNPSDWMGVTEEPDGDTTDILIDDFNAYVDKRDKLEQQSGQSGASLTAVKSSTRQTEDRFRMPTFITLSAITAVILAVGLIGFFTGFGIKEGLNLEICKAACLSYLLITPSYLVYVGAGNPFNLSKSVSTVLTVVGMALMVGAAVLGMTVMSGYGESADGFWGFFFNIFLYINIVVSVVACGLLYLRWCKNLTSLSYMICGIILSLFSPLISAVIVAGLALLAIWTFIRWILSSLGILVGGTRLGRGLYSGWTGKRFVEEYTVTDENGYTHTLHSDNGTDFYSSDGSYYGSSSDGGRTVTRK